LDDRIQYKTECNKELNNCKLYSYSNPDLQMNKERKGEYSLWPDIYIIGMIQGGIKDTVGTHIVPHSIARDAIHSFTYSLMYHSLFSSKELHTYTLRIKLETEKW